MPKAIVFHKFGGPEVLQVEEAPVGEPGQGQVRLRHTAIGVNFIDTNQRTGLYPVPLPHVAGMEGAGVVETCGPGVPELKKGDRVAYTGLPGSYCEARLVPAERLVRTPEGITDEQAASMMLKGMTVHYLIHSTFAVKPGDVVLWHAAAGGVGTRHARRSPHLGQLPSTEMAARVRWPPRYGQWFATRNPGSVSFHPLPPRRVP